MMLLLGQFIQSLKQKVTIKLFTLMTVPLVRRAKEKRLCYLVNLLGPILILRWIKNFSSLFRIYCFHILNPLLELYSIIWLLTVIRMLMQVHIVQRGAVQPLIEMLKSPDAQLREMSAFALGRLAQVSIFPFHLCNYQYYYFLILGCILCKGCIFPWPDKIILILGQAQPSWHCS